MATPASDAEKSWMDIGPGFYWVNQSESYKNWQVLNPQPVAHLLVI